MSTKIKVTHARGANMVSANPQRIESKDGTRWALGRNVKRSLANHRWDAVEVWTLKYRGEDGRAVKIAEQVSRRHAQLWVGRAGLKWLQHWVLNGL